MMGNSEKSMSSGYWEHYSHPSDIGIRGTGDTVEEAFVQAALAMTAVMCELSRIEAKQEVEIVSGRIDDIEILFVEWLNAIVYHTAVDAMLFSRFSVEIDGNIVRAKAWGEKIDADKHAPSVEVKAVTYADLKVAKQRSGKWVAQCIVDV